MTVVILSNKQLKKLMSQLSNLTDAITTLSRSVDALVALPVIPPSGVDPVAVQAAADAVNLQVNRVDAFVAARTTTTAPTAPAASGLAQPTHG